MEAIERNARAQTQLIEDLLDMSRIISGKVRLDVQWTDLAGVVTAAVDSVRPAMEAKGIRLRTILDPRAGPVMGDPTRLQQVVWNLLSNAIKFTPKGGKIDVVLERVNSHLEITVRDSGIGIKPEFLPMIFERFRQVDSSTTQSARRARARPVDRKESGRIARRNDQGKKRGRGTRLDVYGVLAAGSGTKRRATRASDCIESGRL